MPLVASGPVPGRFISIQCNPVDCGEGNTVDIPLVKYSLLRGWIAAGEVIKGLDMWFRTEDRKGEIVILLRLSNVDDNSKPKEYSLGSSDRHLEDLRLA